MIKVSVIIPVYNVEKYLEECLKSVINQTLKEIEIICVNDCSTDRSLDILNKYANMDNRIIIINNYKNLGQSYSRNCGIERACGEYIYFLDSDDMIVEEAMEELYLRSKQHELDVMFFDSKMIFEDDIFKEKFAGYKAERNNDYLGIYNGQDMFASFVNNGEWMASPPRQFWRREHLRNYNLNFYEGIIHEDELFAFVSLMKAKRASYIKKKYFIRRFRANSTMTSPISKKNFEGIFTVYCEILAFWQSNEFSSYINNAIETHSLLFYSKAKSIYMTIRNTEEIKDLEGTNIAVKQLFKLFITGIDKNTIYTQINADKIEKIKKFKKVIIYGAGMVARETLQILDKNQIGIYGFAVSDKKGNPHYIMGSRVYCIEEVTAYCKDAIVLVAVTSKHQSNILKKLNDLQFKNVMIMC